MNAIVFQEDLERVINDYSNMVYRLAFAYTRTKRETDDIYQEVFLRLTRKKTDFISEKEEKAWIIQMTIHCCKKRKPLKSLTLSYYSVQKLELAAAKEESELEQLLSKLPLKYLLVAHLFYEEGYTVEELAKLLKKKPSRIRAYLMKSRSLLQEVSPVKVVRYV